MAEHTPFYEQAGRAGAVFVEEAGWGESSCSWLVPAHFGDATAEYHQAHRGAVLFDHSHHGKIEVAGPDAARILHNLSTNDILHLAPGATCEAFLTTVKAKVIAYLLIFRQEAPPEPPVFWLDVAPGTAERVYQHLDHYLVSEQVEFVNRTADFAQLYLVGPEAPAVLAKASPNLQAGLSVRRRDALGLPGFDLLCPRTEADTLWQRLAEAGVRPAGREAYEMLRIEAGLPRQGADVDETTFAPEVGRISQAICYTKGCYLGQEPIVMARDRGQVNRALLGVKIPSGPVPHGSLLFREGKEVGRVTSSAHSPKLGTSIGLAYVRRGFQTPGTAVEVDVAGTHLPAEVVPLPF
jgi:folate-binding protein YgfZ